MSTSEYGNVHAADQYVSQFTTDAPAGWDEAAPADGWGCYPSCEPGCARHRAEHGAAEAVGGK